MIGLRGGALASRDVASGARVIERERCGCTVGAHSTEPLSASGRAQESSTSGERVCAERIQNAS